MKLNRAYSILNVKEIVQGEDFYVIKGIATTPSTDRYGDVVEPLGAKYADEIPLLWQHQNDKPVGLTKFGKPTKTGIPFEARLPVIKEAGALKDRIEEAIQSIRYKLVAAVSIGFRVLNNAIEFLENGGLRFLETEILELSLVTIPANADATITTIKSIDQELRAASGAKGNPDVKPDVKAPGDSGKSKPITLKKGTPMKLSEQIQALVNQRAEKAARMQTLMNESAEKGVTLDEAQAEEFATLELEVKTIDDQLSRFRTLEKIGAAEAKPVTEKAGASSTAASQTRAGNPTIVIKKDKDEDFKGQNFTRMVIARAIAEKAKDDLANTGRSAEPSSPAAVAEKRWGKTNPTLVELIKANEVAGGGAGSGEWGAELVSADNRYTGDFIEYLYSKTVFDKLPLRQVPANVSIKGQDGAATGYWIGESKAIKMSKPDFSTVSLTPLKVAALTTLSNELLRDSTPAAEQLVRDALVEASAQRIDNTFISTTAASSGVSPAGILNGVSAGSTAGNDVDGVLADISTLLNTFITAKNASGLYWVMNPALATALQLMRNEFGQKVFPDINMNGGTLEGMPVVTGDNINAAHFILLKPAEIWRIGDLGVTVSLSKDATIEQSSAPTGEGDTPTAASQALVNMFQNEMTAFKVVRPVNFQKRRSTAVAYISDAAYGQPAS